MRKFIKDRLNKDNLWNLVFFFGIILSVAITEIIAKSIAPILIIPSTVFSFALSLYFISKLMKKMQSNKRLKKGKFIWGQTLFFGSIMLLAFFVFPFLLFEGITISELLTCNIVMWLLIIPTIYCIYKNLPIKFYFKKSTWYKLTQNSSDFISARSHNSFSRDLSQINSAYNRRHNPINNYSATNSHYRK